MIRASEEVASWGTLGAWKVSPGVPWCAEGNKVVIGNGVRIGNWARIGEGVRLGEGVTLPRHVTFARDLGIQSGYRHVLIVQGGNVKFVGGCHTFTFDQAREYWANKPDRVETLLAVDFAERLAAVIPECQECEQQR